MDFTRAPIIESIITPKEGCKLVIRNTKTDGQEEHFVGVVEIVSFGGAIFFRSTENPKPFLVPVSDYEVLEIREARMIFKKAVVDPSLKIGSARSAKEATLDKAEPLLSKVEHPTPVTKAASEKQSSKRNNSSKRTDRSEEAVKGETAEGHRAREKEPLEKPVPLFALLPPPATLISDTIAQYRNNALFRDAFYEKEEASISSVVPPLIINETGENGE